MIPEGKFEAEVMSVEFGKSSGGHEEVAITCRIVSGDNTDYLMTKRGYFHTPKAEKFSFKMLRTCGWVTESDIYAAPTECPSTLVEIEVEHEDYEGDTFPKIKWINAPGGPGKTQAFSATERDGFRARMAARMQQLSAGTAPTQEEPQF